MDKVFTEDARLTLEKGGWHTKRELSQTEIEQRLIVEGYPLLVTVINFLISFEGLKFSFYNKRRKKQDDFDFSLENASHLVSPEKIRHQYEVITGSPLCIIGTAYREYLVLLMDERGRVYGAFDSYFACLGDNYIEAINNIVEDRDFKELR